jgi:hypothetical protein
MSSAVPYSQRRSPCGCQGVPEGQHLPGCSQHRGEEAPRCERCGYRAATDEGRCAICGALRVDDAPAAPMLLSEAELEHPFGPGIERPERLTWLRTANHADFRVDLWDTGDRPPGGHVELAYRLCVADGARWVLVFSGEGFGAPPAHDLDSDAVLAAIVGFFSLRPGDTDADYFDRYTRSQLAFAEECGEELALWAAELEQDGEGKSRR